jgi:hypothetical protein
LAALDAWVKATESTEGIDHCAVANCHGVVWKLVKGWPCKSCKAWFCMTHWQTTGDFGDNNSYTCQTCTAAATAKPKTSKRQEQLHRGRALLAKKMAQKLAE